jgi:hypothetical protein
MTIVTDVVSRIGDVDAAAYLELRRACGASAFYDPRLLGAVERSPLLPADRTYYLVAYDGPRLVGFVPIYRQSPAVVDPFGVLAQTTSARFEPDARGLFSHVMHCYDSTILYDGGPPVLAALVERLTALGRGQGTRHFVIMNVAEGPLLAAARSLGLNVSYMFDRFHLDLAGIDDFETLIERKLPRDGRHEMRRQLRKFAASGARAVIETVPFARLDELTELCQLTTARRGTPQYLPPAPLAHLVRSCGDMIRLVVVYDRDRIVGGVICIDDGPVLHVWLGGMAYDGIDFSPYSVCFAEAYKYALAQGKQRVEAGRLNAKIKHRLGLTPQPLHAIVSPDLLAGMHAGVATSGLRLRASGL